MSKKHKIIIICLSIVAIIALFASVAFAFDTFGLHTPKKQANPSNTSITDSSSNAPSFTTKAKPESNDQYDKDGFDKNGNNINNFDKEGYDKEGYDIYGYNRNGYNREGYDKNGFDKSGKDAFGKDCAYYRDGDKDDTKTDYNLNYDDDYNKNENDDYDDNTNDNYDTDYENNDNGNDNSARREYLEDEISRLESERDELERKCNVYEMDTSGLYAGKVASLKKQIAQLNERIRELYSELYSL